MADNVFWAQVTKDAPGVPDGEMKPKNFKAGDVILGDLARAAIHMGWAEEGKGDPPVETEVPVAAAVPVEEDAQVEEAAPVEEDAQVEASDVKKKGKWR